MPTKHKTRDAGRETRANPRAVALEVLKRWGKTGAPLDQLMGEQFTARELARKDKALAHELVYGVVRRRLTLDHVITGLSEKRTKVDAQTRDILRLSLYQLIFLDRVPDHAAVNEGVELCRRFRRAKASGFVNAVLRRAAKEKPRPPFKLKDPIEGLSVNLSYPRWLVACYIERFGEDMAKAMLETGNEPADIYLHVNTAKTSAREAKQALKDDDMWCRFVPGMPDALVIDKGAASLGSSRAIASGFAYVQDLSSQLAVRITGTREGERVLDACAAPGGKTAGLWEMMKGKGELVAVEPSPLRLKLLQGNLARLGVRAKVEHADIRELKDGKRFDVVLLDVPCSGTGVMARHPELRWRLVQEEVKRLALLQAELIRAGAALVKTGGRLVYSTCSVLREENEDVVSKFLSAHKEFKIEDAAPFLPEAYRAMVTEEGYFRADLTRDGMDGFFAVRLICTSD